jgi:MarR family transcriptional regulator, multiple antibiotic resistance protein MarR
VTLTINVALGNRSPVDAKRATLIGRIEQDMGAIRASARRLGYRSLLGRSISLTHLHVLTVVQMEGALPMSELARVLGVSVASATGTVTRMEERGLVRRTKGAADRRVVTVELAPGGSAALDMVEGLGREGLRRLLDTLSVDELEELSGGLRVLHRGQQRMTPHA